jgi:O-antigen/teichoic acid export membrane protein
MLKSFSMARFYLIQSFISSFFGLLVISIAAKNIGIHQLGEYLLSYSCALVANTVLSVGLLVVYDRNFFEYDSHLQKNMQDLLIRTLLFFNFFILLFSFVVLYFIPNLYFSSVNLNKTSYLYVFLGTGFNFLSQLLLSRIKNLGEAKKFLMFGVLSPLLFFITFSTGLVLQSSYLNIEFSYVLANGIALIALLFTVPYSRDSRLFNLEILVYSLKIAWPSLPRTLVSSLNNHMDKILAGSIGGPSILALYGVAQLISSSIFVFMTALGRDFQPKVYRFIFSDRGGDINEFLSPYLYLSGLFSLSVCLFSDEILSIFFGEEYKSVSYIVSFLSFVYLAMFISKINGLQLLVEKKTILTSFGSIISILLNYVLIFPFYQYFSIFGFALAFFVSQIFGVVFNYYYAQLYKPLLFKLHFYFLLLGCHAVIFLIYYIFSNNSEFYLLMGLKITGIIVYIIFGYSNYYRNKAI